MILTFTSLILLNLNSVDNEIPKVKEFPEYSCKLTLPGPEFKWSENEMLPGLLAKLKNETEISLVLAIQDTPANAKIDNSTIRQIQDSYLDEDMVTFNSGDILPFRKVPCYQYFLHFKDGHASTVARSFIANRFLYTLYLKMPQDQFEAGDNWDQLFATFEFIGNPKQPSSSYHSPDLNSKSGASIIISILFICLFLVVGAIFIIGIWYRRRNYQQDDFYDF